MATVNMSQPTPYGIQQQHDEACRRSSYLTHIRRTSVMQLIGGCLLIALGIVAIILRAYWSFFSTSIWSGLLIFGLTGFIGMCASSNGNKCLINIYLCMSILACMMGYALFQMHIHAIAYEDGWRYYYGRYYYGCQPGDWYSFIPNCSKSEAARQTFDALICITGFFLFILSIISASFGCCAACKCCKTCCKKCCACGAAPKPVTAVFQHQGAMVSTTGQQQVPYQAGMYIVQQAPPSAMQPQHVSMPAQGSTNQGQTSYMIPPPSANQPQPSHLVAPPQSGLAMQPQPSHLVAPPQSGLAIQPQTSNNVAPPSYYVAGEGYAQMTTAEQPRQEKDGIN